MTERLVSVKSRMQNRIEGGLMLVLPIAFSMTLCYVFGRPSALASIQAPFSLWGTPAVGNVVAAYLGGERITPREQLRRSVEKALTRPWASMTSTYLVFLLLFLALLVPIIPDGSEADFVWLVPVTVCATLVVTLCCWLTLLQLSRTLANPGEASSEAPQPDRFLREYLPFYYLCYFGGTSVGFLVGLAVGRKLGLFALLAGLWAGVLLHQLIRARWRVLRTPPILWYQLNFRQALKFAFLLFGVVFAAFFAAMTPLAPDSSGDFLWFVAAVFAVGGLVFGMMLGFFVWAFSQLGVFRAGKRA
jgi:hypothetical protein